MVKLDDYEKELLESYENDEWESVEDKEAEIKRYRQYAANSLKRNKKISIKITSKDLEDIQKRRLPYREILPFPGRISLVNN